MIRGTPWGGWNARAVRISTSGGSHAGIRRSLRVKDLGPPKKFTHWTISQEIMSTPYVRKARWRITLGGYGALVGLLTCVVCIRKLFFLQLCI